MSRCPLCDSDDMDVRAAHAVKFTEPGTWREHRRWAKGHDHPDCRVPAWMHVTRRTF